MTDEELIDAFHQAKLDHKAAQGGVGDLDGAFLKKEDVERTMFRRFGLGKHLQRYKERYPENAGELPTSQGSFTKIGSLVFR